MGSVIKVVARSEKLEKENELLKAANKGLESELKKVHRDVAILKQINKEVTSRNIKYLNALKDAGIEV